MVSRLFTSLLHAVHVAAEESRIRRPTLPGTVRDDTRGGHAEAP